MAWAHPEWGVWLLAVPAALAGVLLAWRAGRALLERFAHGSLLGELAGSVDWARRRVRLTLVLSAMFALVVAAMGPQWGFQWEPVTRRGIDLVIALDVSNSMLAEDLKPSRLARAKLAIQDLVPLLAGDRIGLVAFAGTAFLQCPLTVDYDAFMQTLDEAGPESIPRGGTAMGPAIRSGLGAFERASQGARVLILLTDGEDHEGTAPDAAAEAKRQGVTIFAVGIGTPEGELIPLEGQAGETFLKDRQGRTVKSRLDEATLQRVAAQSGGSYVRATPTSFGLDALYTQRIAPMAQGATDQTLRRRAEDRFQWPLAIAWLLLLIERLLSDRRPAVEGRG
jgi:Ca-activated chloride channel family protein